MNEKLELTTARPPRRDRESHSVRGGTPDANRLAIAILEVLAGERTPPQAAEALGISLPRYYQVETRALQGLVTALEPKPRGKQPSLQPRIDALERELTQARQACARQQALVRVAQRSLGIKPAPAPESAPRKNGKGPKRRRRKTVRALRAAQALRKKIRQEESPAVQPEAAMETPCAVSNADG